MARAKWVVALLVAGSAAVAAACGPVQVGQGAVPITSGQPGGNQGGANQTSATTKPAGPAQAPAGYHDKVWSVPLTDGAQGQGSGAILKVPVGWAETVRDTYWSDFLDPTGQVRLRANVADGLVETATSGDSKSAADAEVQRLKPAAGFKLIGTRDLGPAGADQGGAEITYQFTRDGQVVQATFEYIGPDPQVAIIGIYYPPDQPDVALQVLAHVRESLRWAG